MFGTHLSPYIATDERHQVHFSLEGYDPASGVCHYFFINEDRYTLAPPFANEAITFELAAGFNIAYNHVTHKIDTAALYHPPQFIGISLGSLDTDHTAGYICNTIETTCPAVWAQNGLRSQQDCTARFRSIPNLFSGPQSYSYLDG